MEEPQLPSDPQPEAPQPPSMSLWGRLFNVFATPGEVFQEVKDARVSTANWLVPALILIVVSWGSSLVIFSQPSITHQLSEITEQAIQQQVEKSKMSEQQAEQARAMGEKWAGISAKIGAALTPVIAGFLTPFFWGLIIWGVGSGLLKGHFPYMKAVEIVGLANMLSILEIILRTLLIVGFGNLYASTSLVLLVKTFDPQNTVHSLLALVNVMTFWLLAVRGVGLARLSGASVAKAVAWVFGVWAAYTGLLVGLAYVAKTAFKRIGG